MSMLNSTCTTSANDTCKDDSGALTLKLVAMSSILVAGATGIAIPLFGSRRSTLLAADSNLFVAAKAFAAGVILATGFVHMMPDGADNLSNTCLPTYPWSSFPFAGFFVMMSALFTLFADFVGTQLYEKKQKKKLEEEVEVAGEVCRRLLDGAVTVEDEPREKHVVDVYVDGHGHGHGHGHGQGHKVGGGKGEDGARHAVVSQVLELGIVSHSVIIGLSLGVSRSPCTIRPLVAALSFHQFFEGFALGGCIAQANFSHLHTAIMACFFAATNPASIAAGVALASFYDPTSAAALIVEGILDCVSAGILIYMALVDLIAAEFMSQQMRSNARLQIVSFLALFLGASLMSSLAIWS